MSAFNRRQFFRLRLTDISREAGKALREDDAALESVPFLRPPGALEDEAEFLATCEPCKDCSKACPYEGVVQHFGPTDGRLEGTPFIDPQVAPCRWCIDMPCINACPVDALKFEESQKIVPMGKVELDLDLCLNSHGTICDTCSMMCPSHIHAIRIVNRMPVLDTEKCTGCGMCLFYCEATPNALTYLFPEDDF